MPKQSNAPAPARRRARITRTARRQPTLSSTLAELRRQTGESAITVGTPDPIWLLRLGLIVDLDIRRWRAQVVLDPQDLGLPRPQDEQERRVFAQLVTLGSKRLMPPAYFKRFNSLDAGARAWLAENSYTTRWGRFVDVGRYPAWKAGNAIYEAAYLKLARDVRDHWDEICAWRRKEYAISARGAYRRLKQLGCKSLQDESGKLRSEPEFIQDYLARIEARVPSREEVFESFGFRASLAYIPLPSILARDQAERERVLAKRALEQAGEPTQLATRQERSAAFDAMHRDVIASVKQDRDHVVSQFVRDIQLQSLQRIAEHLQNAEASIARNHVLVGKVADQLRNAVATYQASGLVKSPSVDREVSALRAAIAAPVNKKQLAEIARLIARVLSAARATLAALSAQEGE